MAKKQTNEPREKKDPYSEEEILKNRTFPKKNTIWLCVCVVAQIALILFAVFYQPKPQDKIEEYYSDVTENEWRTLLEEGIYTYEFVLGEDEEFFRGDANNYYVVIPDFQTKRVNDSSWRILITADLDENTGEEIENIKRTQSNIPITFFIE